MQEIKGTVTAVPDGNTIYVDGKLIELWGVSLPNVQPGSQLLKISQKALEKMVMGKRVTMLIAEEGGERGKGIVLIDGKNINEEILRRGFGIASTNVDNTTEWGRQMLRAQNWAKENLQGFWKSENSKEINSSVNPSKATIGTTYLGFPRGQYGSSSSRFSFDKKIIDLSTQNPLTDKQVLGITVDAARLMNEGNWGYAEVFPILTASAIQQGEKKETATKDRDKDKKFDYLIKPNLEDRKFDKFEIRYKKKAEGKDVECVFSFTFLPAIENAFRGSGQNVPDVTPGLKIQTEMNYQRHLIPGAPPVYQSMGIKGRYMFLVGTFVGNELNAEGASPGRPNPGALDMTGEGKSRAGSTINSYASAKEFEEDVVQTGRPVTITLHSVSDRTDAGIEVEIYGIVEAIRLYCVRADRTYYALTVSCLQFNWDKGSAAEASAPAAPSDAAAPKEKCYRDPMDPRVCYTQAQIDEMIKVVEEAERIETNPSNRRRGQSQAKRNEIKELLRKAGIYKEILKRMRDAGEIK